MPKPPQEHNYSIEIPLEVSASGVPFVKFHRSFVGSSCKKLCRSSLRSGGEQPSSGLWAGEGDKPVTMPCDAKTAFTLSPANKAMMCKAFLAEIHFLLADMG